MPRQRSPSRDKAKEIYLNSKGKVKLKDIAEELGVLDTQIRKWKNQDRWDDELKGTLPKTKRNVTKRKGGQPNNKNAVGHGAPAENKNAETHGFFSKYLPKDTLELVKEIEQKDRLDILWENISIQYAAIIRSQRIMYVESKEEMIKEIKKVKDGDTSSEREWEFQFAWDRQATFLNAQSRAMATLQGMIKSYDELLHKNWELATDEQKLRIEKLKVDIEKVSKKPDENKETVRIVDDI